jgi:eukaryotic-like serine/threonine-protein kinase
MGIETAELKIAPGAILSGRYELVELVGSGGMGSVYRARDLAKNNYEIALKILHPEFSSDTVYVERFIREVELMNKIDHPNVVCTYDIGSENGTMYYTMEFVKGVSLEKILDLGTFPIRDFPALIEQICLGLEAIHSHEIIHRDLKPGNILLLDDGSIKITDFGVARTKSSNLTRKDQRVGSIWYMPPEAWQGKQLKKSADLYSLGVVLYEAITGSLPFEGNSPSELMKQHLYSRVVPPNSLRPNIPSWLNSLILRLLYKAQEDRPKDATEVIKAIGGLDLPSSNQNQVVQPTSSDKYQKIRDSSLESVRTKQKLSYSVSKKRKRRKKTSKSVELLLIALIILSVASFISFII